MGFLRDAVVSVAIALAILCAIDGFKWAYAQVPAASQLLHLAH